MTDVWITNNSDDRQMSNIHILKFAAAFLRFIFIYLFFLLFLGFTVMTGQNKQFENGLGSGKL